MIELDPESHEYNRQIFDGVVITGTGKANTIKSNGRMPEGRILDTESFWHKSNGIWNLRAGTIAVVGAGGGAGTIVSTLIDRLGRHDVGILSISPQGTLFPRGDGYAERRWFSDPSEWSNLTVKDRRVIIGRTEAGVISLSNKNRIDSYPLIKYLSGRVSDPIWDVDEIRFDVTYGDLGDPLYRKYEGVADYLVNAIGFDSWSWLRWVSVPGLTVPVDPAVREQHELAIQSDLAMPTSLGWPAGLHVPNLAALQHGPGLGNLGALGLMAAAILDGYCE